MSTKKQFTPEEIRHLRANPYTRCVTADTISYTLAFKEAFWALSLQGYTGPPPSASWAITRKSWASSGSTTPPSAFGGKPSLWKGFVRAPGAACACRRRQHRADSRGLSKLPDGCGGRSCASQQQMAFKKVMQGCTTSRNSSHGQCRRTVRGHPGGVGGPEEHPHRERAVRIGRCVPLRLLQLGAFRTSQGNEGAEGPGRF